MRLTALTAILALALALAGCGGSMSAAHLAQHSAPSASPAATVTAYSDVRACQAFHQAITKGVPPSAAGTDTLTWLLENEGNASPQMGAAIQRFVSAWQLADPGKISRAQRAVKRLCAQA